MAGWRWRGEDWNEHGRLIAMLPLNRMDPNSAVLEITALIEDCDGDFGNWEVWEDDTLVATGHISCGDDNWYNGKGPQLEAERVIVLGATEHDLLKAARFINANPEVVERFAVKRQERASRRRVNELLRESGHRRYG